MSSKYFDEIKEGKKGWPHGRYHHASVDTAISRVMNSIEYNRNPIRILRDAIADPTKYLDSSEYITRTEIQIARRKLQQILADYERIAKMDNIPWYWSFLRR